MKYQEIFAPERCCYMTLIADNCSQSGFNTLNLSVDWLNTFKFWEMNLLHFISAQFSL